MIFSDECRLEAVTENRQYVRRRPGEKFNENCIQKTVKHPPATMIWSCITYKNPGPLYFVEGTMNKEQYKLVIENIFLPYFNTLNTIDQPYTFMQDGAPCHTARIIKKNLNDNNVPVLPWPGNSPDLNPIENVWSLLKSIVYSTPSTTKEILKKKITHVWENNAEIPQMIRKCIESMPNRIRDVIAAKGGNTKY